MHVSREVLSVGNALARRTLERRRSKHPTTAWVAGLALASLFLAGASVAQDAPIALVIDADSIDKGNEPNDFDEDDVNENDVDIGLRTQLGFFADNPGATITLYTGETGDEGWFAMQSVPATWVATGADERRDCATTTACRVCRRPTTSGRGSARAAIRRSCSTRSPTSLRFGPPPWST